MIVAGKFPRVASTDSPYKLQWPTPTWGPSVICIHVLWGLHYFVRSCFYNLCQQEQHCFLSLWIRTQRWPLFTSISFISWNSPRFKLCHKFSIFCRKNAFHFQTKLFCLKDCNNWKVMNWNILQTLYSEHTTLQKCANHLSYVIRKDCVIQDIKKNKF